MKKEIFIITTMLMLILISCGTNSKEIERQQAIIDSLKQVTIAQNQTNVSKQDTINNTQNPKETSKTPVNKTNLTIQLFTDVPVAYSVSNGSCFCSYSMTKNGSTVLDVDCATGAAVMKINNKFVKFKSVGQDSYSGGDYTLTINTKTVNSSDGWVGEEGHLTLKAKDGSTVNQ